MSDIEDKPQPLMEHLVELRQRLIWAIVAFFAAFLLCFYFAKQLFNMLVVPYRTAVVWAGLDPKSTELIYTAPQEFFFTQIKVAMFGAMVIAFPVIATQIYKFVAPGPLQERTVGVPAIPCRIAGSLPARRGHGLFPLHPHGDVVLPPPCSSCRKMVRSRSSFCRRSRSILG